MKRKVSIGKDKLQGCWSLFAGNTRNFKLGGGFCSSGDCCCSSSGGCRGSCSGCWCSCRFSKFWTLALDWPKPISKGTVISLVKIDSRLKEKFTMMLKRIFHDFSANNSKSTEKWFWQYQLSLFLSCFTLKNSWIG